MTNHLHMIVNCNEPFQLSDVIRDFKRFTSTACFEWIQRNPESRREWMTDIFLKAGNKDPKNKVIKLWQSGNHAIELYNPKFTWTKVCYIHNNPVKAGFVNSPEDWKYSSASNYLELPSVLPEVIRITPPLNYGLK
jgi:REP element-mobilizing transposase RayT